MYVHVSTQSITTSLSSLYCIMMQSAIVVILINKLPSGSQ